MANPNQLQAQQRAEACFDVYMMMGPERSLQNLREALANLGLKYSLNTLKNYSVRYKWQERIEEAIKQARPVIEQQRVEVVSDMNSRQARGGRATQTIALRGLQTLDPTTFTPSDVGTLLEKGVKIERLAYGEATSRNEIAVSLVAPMVQELIVLFQQVNLITDPDARMREFGVGADRILEDKFPSELE